MDARRCAAVGIEASPQQFLRAAGQTCLSANVVSLMKANMSERNKRIENGCCFAHLDFSFYAAAAKRPAGADA